MTARVRGLSLFEQGTKIIAGKPYHFARGPQHTEVNGACIVLPGAVEVLELIPGRDPDEPGTCPAIMKFGGTYGVCRLDDPHPGVDHVSAIGLHWPNKDSVEVTR